MKLSFASVQGYDKGEVVHRGVYKDLHDVYKITNLNWDLEGVAHYFSEQFYLDYKYRLANYLAYIEPGMDARMLMELRKNMVLGFTDEIYYTAHDNCKCAEGVVSVRKTIISEYCPDYKDLPWQYFMLVRYLRGGDRTKRFMFDFESCYFDGDARKQTSVEQYGHDFVKAHLEGYVPKISVEGRLI